MGLGLGTQDSTQPGDRLSAALGRGTSGWRCGRPRKTGGSGAVVVMTADMWQVQTEPHAVPSFMSPHSHPEKSG